jgi:hypothetical protein
MSAWWWRWIGGFIPNPFLVPPMRLRCTDPPRGFPILVMEIATPPGDGFSGNGNGGTMRTMEVRHHPRSLTKHG